MTTKNIFVSHYHADADSIEKLKALLAKHGMTMKDSSIYENKSPNNATSESYIKQEILTPQINWAGTVVVLVGPKTYESDYVNWEIEHAAREGKRIVGVYLPGKDDSELPKALKDYGNALRHWNGKSIIESINGEDIWDGPERNWGISHSTC